MSSTVVSTEPVDTADAEPGARRTFLPEVQALRAVAVLLVVGYHLRPDLVPGGFIGVDVFFVISGFLITGQMIREVTATGRLRLAHFWANRARRILPAGLLVILVVTLTAGLIIPVTEWQVLQRQAFASIFYVQNWVLAADSVDYSASDNAATPFQHFWSLAVEEQFYLLWPLLVVAAARIALPTRDPGTSTTDTRQPAGRTQFVTPSPFVGIVVIIFALVVTASFALSVLRVAADDPAAYFVTTTRLWELGVGGILAVVLRYTDGFRLFRSALALAGAAAIGVGSFVLSSASPFPGVAALLPVLGAAAVIAAGRTSGPGSLTWLVDRAPVQWVGNVSYSLYLWHFPVAIYFSHWRERDPSLVEVAVLVLIMLALAAASYAWVEQPLRKAPWLRRSDLRALLVAAIVMGLVAGVAAVVVRPDRQTRDWDAAARAARTQGDDQHGGQHRLFGAGSPRSGSYRPFIGEQQVMTPNPITAKTDDDFLDTRQGRCEPKRSDELARQCEFGDPRSDTVVAVVGDSHARMYTPAVLKIAERRGWRVVTFLLNSCPYAMTPRTYRTAETCLASNRYTAQRLARLRPDLVVTSYYAGSRFVGGNDRAVAGFAKAWRRLTRLGAGVVVITDAPTPRPAVQACVAEHYTTPDACSIGREQATVGRWLTDAAAAEVGRVRVLDLTDCFCNRTTCPPVIGNVLVYRDGNHVGRTYMETLVPDIEPALTGALDLGRDRSPERHGRRR